MTTSLSEEDDDDDEGPLYPLPPRRRARCRTALGVFGGVGERAEDLEPPRYRAECREPDLGMALGSRRRIPSDGLYDASSARTLRLSGLEEEDTGRIRHAPKSKGPFSGRTCLCGSKKSDVVGPVRLGADAVGGLSIGHVWEAPATTGLQAAPQPDLERDPESLLPTPTVPSPVAAGNSGGSSLPPGAAANPGGSGGSSPPLTAAANPGGSGDAGLALAAGGGGPADPGDAAALRRPPPNERNFNWELGHLSIAAAFLTTLYQTLDSETTEWIKLSFLKCAKGYTYLMIFCGLIGIGITASTSVIFVRFLRDIASFGSRLSSVVATFLMIVAISKPVGYLKGIISGAIVSTIMIGLWLGGSPDAREGLLKFWNWLKSAGASGKTIALSAWGCLEPAVSFACEVAYDGLRTILVYPILSLAWVVAAVWSLFGRA